MSKRKLSEQFRPDVCLTACVPTYYPKAAVDQFDKPRVPVSVHESDGLKLILGTPDPLSLEQPDVQIERRAHGWAVFVHPVAGGDPCGAVYFHDDGRSWFVRESDADIGTPRLQLADECPAEIDLA